ncbi:MAG: response regulator transcription factor [Deltaproteobacteria bacterium]|nr:response regulator transcription factor [Deltaproteobacteria bacterium]
MPSKRILVIEDEHDFAEVVIMNLKRSGYEATGVRTGEDGLAEIPRMKPDLVLLDLNLPDMSGHEVCRRLKYDPSFRSIPVIMVTARGEEVDRVVGLELGADDYMVKPVSMREMVLRVNAVLRRNRAPATEQEAIVAVGSLRIDGAAHRAFVNDLEINLTALEFKLLLTLVTRPGRVQSRSTLLDHVWGIHADLETRTVDTMMKRLRDKLGDAGRFIETVRGVGYRFSADV